MLNWVLVFIAVILGACGQLLMKHGMSIVGQISISSIPQILNALTNPFVFLGFAVYAISSILWLSVISKLPLSVAYPILSMGYVIVVFGSYFFFKEPLSTFKIIGVACIILGVTFIGRG